MVPGIGIAAAGLVMFFLLSPSPQAAGFQPEQVWKKKNIVHRPSSLYPICFFFSAFYLLSLLYYSLKIPLCLSLQVLFLILSLLMGADLLWQDEESADEKEEKKGEEEKAISLFGALKIPGVVEFSLW